MNINTVEIKKDYAKVLIVDTDIELYEYSVGIWDQYGITSCRVDNIEQALREISLYKYHLIVIVECKEQRPLVLESIQLFRELTLASIVIASNDPLDPEYCITAYDLGADEVWGMPKIIEEAVAKGNAIIRRYLKLFKEIDTTSTIIANKHIIINEIKRLVYVKGNKVDLTRIEFDLLALLISHPGRVYTYEQIFSDVWGEEFAGNSKEVLRNQICKLRDKLKINSTLPNFIKTNQGIGYSFAPEYDR